MQEEQDNKIEGKKVIELSIDDILPNRFQPRIKFEDNAIFELSESIKAHGVFQPIIVRPIGDKYEIIAGERRYKASVLANKKTIPTIIMDLDDNDTVEIALIENVQRANLTPIEEAISYKKILDMGYMNQDELASKLGKTQSTIANKLRLLNLDEEVQEALLENKISERHARSLLRLKDYVEQRLMLKRIINERLTVRKADEEIEKMINNNGQNDNPIIIEEPKNEGIPEIIEEPVESVSNSFNNITTDSVASPIFGDVNNEVINPTLVNENVSTSTVMNNSNQILDIPKDEATVMDVDKIENTATDVNIEKPVAPMDKFLTPSMENNNELPVEEEKPEDLLRPGKFFNFGYESNETEEKVEDTSAKNFTFDNLYQDVAKPVESTQDSQKENSSNPVNVAPVTPVMTSETLVNETSPVASPITNDVYSMPDNSNENLVNNPVVDNNISSTPFGFENDTVDAPDDDIITTPFGNINSNNIDVEETPSNVQTNNSLESINSTIPTTIPAYQNVEMVKPQFVSEKNIHNAIETIREAVGNVEQMGYIVDVDEIDLENMYQMIIKIEK